MTHVDTSYHPLVTLSLCHGIGGLDAGVERALTRLRYPLAQQPQGGSGTLKYAAYVEIESIAAWNVVAKMEQGVLAPAPLWTDVKTFPWKQFYGKIHLITGGYPCQPFSQAGLQNGVDDPRHLFPFIEQGIAAVRPVLCFFENVANHLVIGYSEVRERISSLGYKVEADIFSAQQVGAPHLRKRLFILAVADAYCGPAGSAQRADLRQVLGLPQEIKAVHGTPIPRRNGDEVAHATSKGLSLPGQAGVGQFRPESGTGLDDRSEQQRLTMDDTSGRFAQPEDKIPAGGNATPGPGAAMDHTISEGLQGLHRNGSSRQRWERSVRSIASASVWPAPQGPEQYEWEHDRLESGVGFTVNGYNYREDLLRMAGNSVVPQQAELAFLTLLDKFL